jgi:hypothetical protein
MVKYCSRSCQEEAWDSHKDRCRRGLGITPPGGRATMRVDALSAMRPVDGDGDTIYYVETSTPHLFEIKISGPFSSLQAALP